MPVKFCVIHGSNRKGNTDRTIEIVKEHLNQKEENDYTDFYLPKDLPCFCHGCFSCIISGEYGGQNCPHKEYTHPILQAMTEADGIIFASPSYALAESAQIKALLDHYACIFVNHRPHEVMFDKVALVVSTAAGAGTGRVVSTISRSLLFWGLKRIVKCKINMWAIDWYQMPSKKRQTADRKLENKVNQFYYLTKKRYKLHEGISRKFIRLICKKFIKNLDDTSPDKIYWKSKGWI